MKHKRKLLMVKLAVAGTAIPILLWAYEYGPDPGHCGVPGEGASCISGGVGNGHCEVLLHAGQIGQSAGKCDANAALVILVVGRSGMATARNTRRAFSGHSAVTRIWAVFVGP